MLKITVVQELPPITRHEHYGKRASKHDQLWNSIIQTQGGYVCVSEVTSNDIGRLAQAMYIKAKAAGKQVHYVTRRIQNSKLVNIYFYLG